MRLFRCACGNVLFFGSSRCLQCGCEAGYDPSAGTMRTFHHAARDVRRCANGLDFGVCNWLLPAASPETLCLACRLNRMIPDLSGQRNRLLWSRMEMAKRRLLYGLLALGVPLRTLEEDPQGGLAFDIVSTTSNPSVTTGHLNGVITVNLEEADDTYRQINRGQFGEPSRTLLGHFRHESGHYLWSRSLSRLDWGHPLRTAFRARFGDEWLDYAAALTRHYRSGPPANWEKEYITAYAASHPWEDWAETWSHYLQIVEGVETCESLGLRVGSLALPLVRLPGHAGSLPPGLPSTPAEDGAFLALLQRWTCLSSALNEIAQSLGEALLYPFFITVPVAQKLRYAHHFATRRMAIGPDGQDETDSCLRGGKLSGSATGP